MRYDGSLKILPFSLTLSVYMAGRRMIYGGDSGGAHDSLLHPSSEPMDSLFLSRSSPSFLGSRSMVSFEDAKGVKRSERPFFHSFDQDDNVDEEYDEYFHQPEKKRRLTVDQVQFLEKSFEIDNKLEPERKVQLAKDLGLQPRQVAIWFQNRRARWKTKQLEKDYDVLQSSYNSLKADFDGLLKEKEKLNAEVLHLSNKLKQQEKTDSDLSDSSMPPKSSPTSEPIDESVSEDEAQKSAFLGYNQEDISSVKSDVLDSDSPRYAEGGHSSFLEVGDTSYVFEPDQSSDLSQDEEDNLNRDMLSTYIFPKVENDDYSDPSANSFYLGFPVEEQAFGFWPY